VTFGATWFELFRPYNESGLGLLNVGVDVMQVFCSGKNMTLPNGLSVPDGQFLPPSVVGQMKRC
jgi:hypothetical protein